jgi:hypothetical protein
MSKAPTWQRETLRNSKQLQFSGRGSWLGSSMEFLCLGKMGRFHGFFSMENGMKIAFFMEFIGILM